MFLFIVNVRVSGIEAGLRWDGVSGSTPMMLLSSFTPQQCLLSLTTLHSRSVPLKFGDNLI